MRMHFLFKQQNTSTVEPRYNEDLGNMEIALLYRVSPYIRVKKQQNTKSWDQQITLTRAVVKRLTDR